ncbi:zinc-dependent metalloprotease [Pedobacter nyackensis]|uniref:zinc-dependent metalloprotease n=1 Tax=Pedobacter nyackensis TaxID=475255 RepID=UPI00292F528C|nr:zinc-dependent metalloprotease [Pedobacter nyackensis]
MYLKLISLFLLMGVYSVSEAQNKTTGKAPLPYAEVITAKAVTTTGMFKVHKQDDRYLFEIPDSLLGRDILVVNRISRSAVGLRISYPFLGHAGDEIGQQVIRFERGPGTKMLLRGVSYLEKSADSSKNGMHRSVINSNIQPIISSFDIKAFSPEKDKSRSSVIDVTDFFSADNETVAFDGLKKKILTLNDMISDRSFIDTIRPRPNTIEIRTIKTYNKKRSEPMAVSLGAGPQPVTFELNCSMLLLPKKPMRIRFEDPRVGYFTSTYTDFDVHPQGVEKAAIVSRWRLEPRKEDIQKYLKGTLVEPAKPIVFYIDPTTPKKWVPYLIQGVKDWNIAFEQAGWKNAITAKEAPVNDPNWSIEDASHSAIVYKPSDIQNASGPSIEDPRSGEILESHINWFHNIMNLVHDWYFIQAAAIDPEARKMIYSDELMGELIRFVSSHEVGHTLGLQHNFGASNMVPVENLRNKKWVEANGHTPSIMDYARFNYVAQPEDNITQKGIFPRIGAYDKWAIEWAYRWFPDNKTKEEEKAFLNNWVSKKIAADKQLRFMPSMGVKDPRLLSEVLGDNAMKANTYGIKNLKRIMPHLLEWTREPNDDYKGTERIYKKLVDQYRLYINHVLINVGGVMATASLTDENKQVFEFVPKATQKEAVTFLQDNLFTTPTWLISKEIFQKTGTSDRSTVVFLQESTLSTLLNKATFKGLMDFETIDPANAYTVAEMVSDLQNGIWSELPQKKAIDVYRRSLQKLYTEQIVAILNSKGSRQSAMLSTIDDSFSIVTGQAKKLAKAIETALPFMTDEATKLHLQDMQERLSKVLNPRNA